MKIGEALSRILILSATPDPFLEDHGGKQRLVKLTKALTKKHKVTLLSLSWAGKNFETKIDNNISHISVSPEANLLSATKTKSTNLTNPNNDSLISYYKKFFKPYKLKMNELAKTHDIIIVDHWATAPMIDYLTINIPVFYSSQNCETDLALQIYDPNSADVALINKTERSILEKSKAFSYCSTEDLVNLHKHFIIDSESFYIPNGADMVPGIKSGSNSKSKDILFIGSGHPPNGEAAKTIIQVARLMPEYNFIIAGDCVRSINNIKTTDNITKIRNLSNDEVDALFAKAFAFINPMKTGSGTHLKMMKALSYGLPIVASDIGARGFDDKEKAGCMIIANDINSTVSAIKELEDNKLYKEKSKNSLELSKQYDWDVIGDQFLSAIDTVLDNRTSTVSTATNNSKKKVLVYSIIRNEKQFIDQYYEQLRLMVDKFPKFEFYLSIYENDSTDGTKRRLLNKDWSMFAGFSFISENIHTEYYGSVKDADRVKNLSIARNKAIEAADFLDKADYVMMIEADMEYNMSTVKKILEFDKLEPDFDIVSGITLRNGGLYDQWATRKGPQYIPGVSALEQGFRSKPYDKYYSTSNGICLYRAEPFREGVRYGWINTVTGEFDCDTVVVCQNFHAKGYSNIYIIHTAEIYHEHK